MGVEALHRSHQERQNGIRTKYDISGQITQCFTSPSNKHEKTQEEASAMTMEEARQDVTQHLEAARSLLC